MTESSKYGSILSLVDADDYGNGLENEDAYGLLSVGFWRSYIVLMRPYLLFVSGLTGIAGLALVPDVPDRRLFVLIPLFFGTYGFGQALTDCFQMDTDALSSPYRPLVQGIVRRVDVLTVSLGGLIAAGVILGICSAWTLPLAAVCIVGLATYTYFKRIWWAGPLYNATIVAGLYVIAYLSGGGEIAGLVRIEVALAGAAVFFGYANFVLTGYYKDISADRATGYDTLPVHFGMRKAAFVSDALAVLTLLSVVACVSFGDAASISAVVMGFLGLGIAASLLAQYRLHRLTHEVSAHRAIEPVVHGFLLFLSAIAAAARPRWAIPLAVCYVLFVVVLRQRPMQSQI